MLRKLAIGLAICTVSAGVLAQGFSDVQARQGNSAYIQDSRGVIARSPFGLCWRTGYWTPADAVPGCDGELTLPVANPIAPPLAQAPAAAAPVAPPPPQPKRCDFAVTLGSDQAFEFNKAVLNSSARKRLDEEVLAKLGSCAKVDTILVTGHADRLGSQQYNQRLSEKRANAVADYLKNKGATGEIDTLGAGKTQSIKGCDDKLSRKELIACLAPNRRVGIEIRGIAK